LVQEISSKAWQLKGAEVYDYSGAQSFHRALSRGQVLGAQKVDGVWRSHPQGVAGSVSGHRFIRLPKLPEL